MEEVNFAAKVYAIVSQIPRGKVTTYKAIAEKLGMKGYQAIGQVLKCNPFAPEVPCHRVVKSNGELGGFKGSQHNDEKRMLLEDEGVRIKNGKVDLELFAYDTYF